MGQKVSIIAQLCLDSFLQDFRTASAFFTKKHFEYYVILADAKLKQDEYNLQVFNNLRARKPNAPVVFNSDNYFTIKKLPVKEDKVLLPFPIMAFPGVGNTKSISLVRPEGNCGNLMPITESQRWMACDDKNTVYWLPAAETEEGCSAIEFINKDRCRFQNVDVTYIRTLTKNSSIQEARGYAIISMVCGMLKTLKDGLVIDTTNDANPNTSPQTELNNNMVKALQGR